MQAASGNKAVYGGVGLLNGHYGNTFILQAACATQGSSAASQPDFSSALVQASLSHLVPMRRERESVRAQSKWEAKLYSK